MFFNVSDRLGNGGYIAHVKIGPVEAQEVGVEALGTFWKHLGYHGGTSALDVAIGAVEQGSPSRPAGRRSGPR